jgi:hypothetical protein
MAMPLTVEGKRLEQSKSQSLSVAWRLAYQWWIVGEFRSAVKPPPGLKSANISARLRFQQIESLLPIGDSP